MGQCGPVYYKFRVSKMLRHHRGYVHVHKKVLIPFVRFISLITFCRKSTDPYQPFIKMLCPLPLHRSQRQHKHWPETGWFAYKLVTLLSTTFLKLLKNERTFLNTHCDTCSCKPLLFVYFGIFRKITTKGIIRSTASTEMICFMWTLCFRK